MFASWARGAEGVDERGWGTLRRGSFDEVNCERPDEDGVLRGLSGTGLLVDCEEGLGEAVPFN
jgi:hypothetical protein